MDCSTTAFCSSPNAANFFAKAASEAAFTGLRISLRNSSHLSHASASRFGTTAGRFSTFAKPFLAGVGGAADFFFDGSMMVT